jgi:2-haloacid dehalogenase
MLPKVYVFDAYGTLFDVHSAVGRHEVEIGADFPRLSEVWRRKQLEYSWIRTLLGRYLDFAELTEQALDYAIKQVAPQRLSLKSQLLAAYRHLEAYQDVRTALSQFKARGANSRSFRTARRKC